MPETQYITTQEAAETLGVGVSTVKRWVDDGLLPAHKTAGGHRKLRTADVLRMAKERSLPLRHEPAATSEVSTAATDLYRALRAGERATVERIIREAFHELPMPEIADELIRPALVRIGHEWEVGRLEVYREHVATQLCVDALVGLKRIMAARLDESGPLALGGSPEAHWHTVGNLLAELTLIENGWRVTNVGANTPLASLGAAVKAQRPRLVWLSIGPVADPAAFESEYKRFYLDAREAGAAVAIGGLGLSPELRARLPYSAFGDGLTQLAEFARSLHAPPRPPKRGRPSNPAPAS